MRSDQVSVHRSVSSRPGSRCRAEAGRNPNEQVEVVADIRGIDGMTRRKGHNRARGVYLRRATLLGPASVRRGADPCHLIGGSVKRNTSGSRLMSSAAAAQWRAHTRIRRIRLECHEAPVGRNRGACARSISGSAGGAPADERGRPIEQVANEDVGGPIAVAANQRRPQRDERDIAAVAADRAGDRSGRLPAHRSALRSRAWSCRGRCPARRPAPAGWHSRQPPQAARGRRSWPLT